MSQDSPKISQTNTQVIIFIVLLSVISATILSTISSALGPAQEQAVDFDRHKQMMIAAKVLSHEGYFLIENDKGEYVPAKYTDNGLVEQGSASDMPAQSQVIAVFNKRFRTRLVDRDGNLITFEKAGIDEQNYLHDFKKSGYYKQPFKLIYEILPNSAEDDKPMGYVIPINGYGLWDAIYGYLAIKTDGDTVIGTTWYEQKETPGLGSDMSEAKWQAQFLGKKIFQESPDGSTAFDSAPLGITVVKGKVNELLGTTPKAKSAVDGMPGATLTGNGITQAYKDVLAAYRPFLLKIEEENSKESPAPAPKGDQTPVPQAEEKSPAPLPKVEEDKGSQAP